MVSELLCPDCGGVVGATESTEAGFPCKCFVPDPSAKFEETAVGEPAPVEAPKLKLCRLCSKDLAGHRRLKDSLGYLCYECAKAEEKRELGDRVRCRVCGHLVKETSITDYEGTKMCSKCYGERMDLKKQQIKRIGIRSARTRAELSQLQKWLVIGGVLLGVILLSTLYVMSRHH